MANIIIMDNARDSLVFSLLIVAIRPSALKINEVYTETKPQ